MKIPPATIGGIAIKTEAIQSRVGDYRFSIEDLNSLMNGTFTETKKSSLNLGLFQVESSTSRSGSFKGTAISGDTLADIESLLTLEANKQIEFGTNAAEAAKIRETLTDLATAGKKGLAYRELMADKMIDCMRKSPGACPSIKDVFDR
jgi:hypothetical protein